MCHRLLWLRLAAPALGWILGEGLRGFNAGRSSSRHRVGLARRASAHFARAVARGRRIISGGFS